MRNRWFRGLAMLGILVILLGGSVFGGTGQTKESYKTRLLSAEDVSRTYAQHGLKLMPLANEPPNNSLILDGVRPAIYQIAGTEDRVFIYVFGSHEKRVRYCTYSFTDSFKLKELFQPYGKFSSVAMAKNVLSVYVPSKVNFPPGDPAVEKSKKINDFVFNDLNQGRTRIFRGEGQFWEAQVIYRSTLQFYKDSKGVLHPDSWETENAMARYKGGDFKDVGSISYQLTRPYGSSSGTGSSLNAKRIFKLGGLSGNGAQIRADDLYTLTIEWNGRSETFVLKAYPDVLAFFPYQ